MRFFVLGNINAGKSTFADLLHTMLENICHEQYEILRIDDFRRKYSNESIEGEKEVAKQFAKAVQETRNAIIELCGFGESAAAILKGIESNSAIIFYLNTALDICLQRIESKRESFAHNRYFAPIEKIADTIRLLDTHLQNGNLQAKWSSVAIRLYEVKTGLDYKEFLEQIPLYQYHALGLLKDEFKASGYKRLIAYGSLGRGDMTKHSDIDLILLTKDSVSQVLGRLTIFLERSFARSKCFILHDKIVVLGQNLMIEIVVTKHIKEHIKYYHGSHINDISKSILLGNRQVEQSIKKALMAYANMHKVLEYSIENCINKVEYYLFFLQKMADENDIFRFHFYNNLILDSLLRIICIKHNQTKYLYCPKHTNALIETYNFKSLAYDMKGDMWEHIERLQKRIAKIVHAISLCRPTSPQNTR